MVAFIGTNPVQTAEARLYRSWTNYFSSSWASSPPHTRCFKSCETSGGAARDRRSFLEALLRDKQLLTDDGFSSWSVRLQTHLKCFEHRMAFRVSPRGPVLEDQTLKHWFIQVNKHHSHDSVPRPTKATFRHDSQLLPTWFHLNICKFTGSPPFVCLGWCTCCVQKHSRP